MPLFNPVAPGIGQPYTPVPSSSSTEDPTVAQWNAYVAQIQAALAASSGWERTKFESQLADAQKGRDNAMKIAELNAQTSRYGTNVQAATQLAQLRQNQQQFEANHGLEIAKAWTQFSQTPDMMWAANEFKGAMANVGQGRSVGPISEQPAPHAKTWADFAVLSGYGNNGVVQAKAGGGGGASGANVGSGGSGSKGDLRLKAVKAIGEAMPPSDGVGHDEQDWEALNAVKSLYFSGNPQGLNRLGAPRRKIAAAGMGRLGYDPALAEYDYNRGLANRGSAGAA